MLPAYDGARLFASRNGLESQFRADLNRRLQAAINGTSVGKEPVHPIRRRPMRFLSFEFELHVNSFDDEHIVFQLDLT